MYIDIKDFMFYVAIMNLTWSNYGTA